MQFYILLLGHTSNTLVVRYAKPQPASVLQNYGPTQGFALSHVPIVVSGSNFGVSTPNVTVGGRNCPLVTFGNGVIQCQTPAGVGSVPVVVTVNGQSSDGSLQYTYAAPTVSSVSPNHAPTSGRTDPPIAAGVLLYKKISCLFKLSDISFVQTAPLDLAIPSCAHYWEPILARQTSRPGRHPNLVEPVCS
jgi:hypothetical protein